MQDEFTHNAKITIKNKNQYIPIQKHGGQPNKTMKNCKYILTLFLAAASLDAQSIEQDSFTYLTKIDDTNYFVTSGKLAQKFGNTISISIISINKRNQLVGAEKILAPCNGSWFSSPFQNYKALLSKTTPDEVYAAAASHETPPTEEIHFQDLTNIDQPKHRIYKSISTKLSGLCKQATAVNKKEEIPIASTESGNREGEIISFLPGKTTIDGSNIKAWIKITKLHIEPANEYNLRMQNAYDLRLKRNNEQCDTACAPLPYPPPTPISHPIKTALNKYDLMQVMINCHAQQIGPIIISSYDNDKPTKFANFEDIKLVDPIPGTVADAEIEAICRMYSAR